MSRARLVPALALAAAALAGLAGSRVLAQEAAEDHDPPIAPQAPPAGTVAAKEAKVRQLLRLQGAEEQARLMFDQMIDAFGQSPGLPDGFVDAFKKRAKPSDMVEVNVPLLMKHLDDATLDAAIAFMGSAEGKRFVAAQPAIQQEAMVKGQELGQRWAMEAMQDVMGGGAEAPDEPAPPEPGAPAPGPGPGGDAPK